MTPRPLSRRQQPRPVQVIRQWARLQRLDHPLATVIYRRQQPTVRIHLVTLAVQHLPHILGMLALPRLVIRQGTDTILRLQRHMVTLQHMALLLMGLRHRTELRHMGRLQLIGVEHGQGGETAEEAAGGSVEDEARAAAVVARQPQMASRLRQRRKRRRSRSGTETVQIF